MQQNYGASWRFSHSLHLIIFFLPIFGFIGFFRRKSLSGQKKWAICGWIYLAVTLAAGFASQSNVLWLKDGLMNVYIVFYMLCILYAFLTLPSYLNAVTARLENGGRIPAEEAPQHAPHASEPSRVNPDMPHDDKRRDAAKSPTDATMQNIHRLGALIANQEIYPELCEIETVCIQILEYVADNPDKKSSAHSFTSYYLPEYTKLLHDYVELYQMPVKTDKILQTMERIEGSLPTVTESFKNVYNSLYSEKADEISNSIDIFERMMSQDGLTDDPVGEDSSDPDKDPIQLKL